MAIAGQAQPFNRQQPKRQKVHKENHVANTKYGMGDYTGQAIKQKVGRVRDVFTGSVPVSQKGLKKPPKSLA